MISRRGFQIRAHEQVFNGHILDLVIFGGPFGAIFLAVAFDYVPDGFFIYAYVSAGLLIAILLIRQMRRFRYLSCPSCKTRLEVDEVPEGERITFTCERCRIIWKTCFLHSTD